MRPRVAITCGRRPSTPGPGPRVRPSRSQVVLNEIIVSRVREAGGIALVLPPGDTDAVEELREVVDAIVVTGGAFDIHPRHYGQVVRGRLDGFDDARTEIELACVRMAVHARIPFLGVCGGMQALAVGLGGTLVQDLTTERPGGLDHEQAGDPAVPDHALLVHPDWAAVLPDKVNSTHHQAVDGLGPLRPVAWAADGVVEAVDLPGHPFCLGVQWHPELFDARPYTALLDAARVRRGSRP